MTRKEFNQMFEACRRGCMPASKEEILEKLSKYSNTEDKLDPTAMAVFTYVESMNYVNAMLYATLAYALDVPEKDD